MHEPYSSAILAEGLTKTFDVGRKALAPTVIAVDHINLDIGAGEFYGFLGPNGAGKSTTIKMLTGLLRPTSGRMVIAGCDLTADPLVVKARIGVLPEDLNLYERLTASEFLMFAAQMHGLPSGEARRRAGELLRLMELEDASGKLIIDFSMGMKKKVALAGAMIHAPRVLFLDEPFNGIDALSARSIRDVLHRMTDSGTTIFFSSHVMEVVEKLCTRLAIIAGGKLVGEGTMDMLRGQAHAPGASLDEVFYRLVRGDTSPFIGSNGDAGEPPGIESLTPSDLSWLSPV